MTAYLQQALRYYEEGWKVIPLHSPSREGCSCGDPDCTSPGKHPRIPWKNNVEVLNQSKDTISKWWNKYSDANLGILTGQISGVVVLDIDGSEGEEALRNEGISIPSTRTVITARGRHFYFKAPEFPIKNTVNILPKVDIRGDGGIIVAPPSTHMSGIVYRWETETEDLPLAEFPERIIHLLASYNHQAQNPCDLNDKEVFLEGERNIALTSLAGNLRRKGISENGILKALNKLNIDLCNPPLTCSEVAQIAHSIAQYPHQDDTGPDASHTSSEGISLEELIQTPATHEISETPLLGGIFPRGYCSIIAGEPKCGKTWLTLNIACALSKGDMVVGSLPCPNSLTVLFIENDSAKELLDQRIAKVEWSYDPERLKIVSGDILLKKGIDLDLSTIEGRSLLSRLIQVTHADVVFIDSLTTCHTLDENNNSEMRDMYKSLAGIAHNHQIALVLIHHSRKRKKSEEHLYMSQNDIVGAGVQNRIAATLIGVEKKKGGNTGQVLVKCLGSWFREFEEFAFEIITDPDKDTVDLSFDHSPSTGGGKKGQAWGVLFNAMKGTEGFSFSEACEVLENIISTDYLKKCLHGWIKEGKMIKEGNTKDTIYHFP